MVLCYLYYVTRHYRQWLLCLDHKRQRSSPNSNRNNNEGRQNSSVTSHRLRWGNPFLAFHLVFNCSLVLVCTDLFIGCTFFRHCSNCQKVSTCHPLQPEQAGESKAAEYITSVVGVGVNYVGCGPAGRHEEALSPTSRYLFQASPGLQIIPRQPLTLQSISSHTLMNPFKRLIKYLLHPDPSLSAVRALHHGRSRPPPASRLEANPERVTQRNCR